MGEYYYEYLGCFKIQKQTNYINFKNLTLSKCIKFCNYFNSTIAGSGLQCICLNDQQIVNKDSDINCQNLNSNDWHFSGNDQYYGVYRSKTLKIIKNVSTTKEHIFFGNYSVFFHQVIIELDQNSKEKCQYFCMDYRFSFFGIRERNCYCGNSFQEYFSSKIEIYKSLYEDKTTYHPSTEKKDPTTHKVDFSTEKKDPATLNEDKTTYHPSTEKKDPTTLKVDFSKLLNLTVLSEPITLFQSVNDLTLENAKFILEILNDPTQDLTGCLTNCSNNGWCGKIEEKIKCKCFNQYKGSNCGETTNICKKEKICLNNGICIPLENNLNYKCECKYPYYGENCQYEIDLCQNITCLNGICYVNDSKSPFCKCFNYYKGERCQEPETNLIIISSFIKISSVIAIMVICCLFLILILSDGISIFNACTKGNKPKKNTTKSRLCNQKNKLFK